MRAKSERPYLRRAVISSGGSYFLLSAKHDAAADPECGKVMQGTDGLPKVRADLSGMGKRGVARVIYREWQPYWSVEHASWRRLWKVIPG